MANIHINNFFLISNIMAIFKVLKKSFAKKYNIKNFERVKTIIK